MLLNGAAEMRKTQVIHALKDFFYSCNKSCQFHICSYMNIAARNIADIMLHSALCIRLNDTIKSKSTGELMRMWDGTDILFIDEVFMLSCWFLCQISRTLYMAKSNSLPFENISIIFAGDSAQLLLIVEKCLYSYINTAKYGKISKGQDIMFGKLL